MKYLVGRTNEWVANPLGLRQTIALQKRLDLLTCSTFILAKVQMLAHLYKADTAIASHCLFYSGVYSIRQTHFGTIT